MLVRGQLGAPEIKNLKNLLTKETTCGTITTQKERKNIMDFEKKRNQLKDASFKMVYKHPYSVARTKLDRIGRQIRELDEKVKPGKSKAEKTE